MREVYSDTRRLQSFWLRIGVKSKMSVTISTHNGSQVRTAHNIRAKNCVEKQEHIDPARPHETWQHETISHAYERLFSSAVSEYNSKQQRPERKIKNYLAQVQKDAKKHPCYEMIVGVYGEECSDRLGKEILRAYVDDWQSRNPQLELIGAYYHADEQGRAPHVHLDYIPVSSSYKKGLCVQTGLNRALKDMGYEKRGNLTAQIQWEKAENAVLEHFCREAGLTVEHPQLGKGVQHQTTELYKTSQELKKAKERLERTEQEVVEMGNRAAQSRSDAFKLMNGIESLKNQLNALQRKYELIKTFSSVLPMSLEDIRGLHPTKSFAGIKGITLEEIEILRSMALETGLAKCCIAELKSLRAENKSLREQCTNQFSRKSDEAMERAVLERKAAAFDSLSPSEQERLLSRGKFNTRDYNR